MPEPVCSQSQCGKKEQNTMKPTYINITSKDCGKKFYCSLKEHLQSINKAYDEICVACIGTDRSTGDSLGPLVGHKLNGKRRKNNVRVVGTLDDPLHAKNLDKFIKFLNQNTLVIAVDACLGKMDHVGYITVSKGPIKPGIGVNKDLPPVGDIAITGIVNFGGFMDYLVLQNTRLNTVMRMADIIATGLNKVLKCKSRDKVRRGYGLHMGKSPK
jgi:putative sporulation protein YyaC